MEYQPSPLAAPTATGNSSHPRLSFLMAPLHHSAWRSLPSAMPLLSSSPRSRLRPWAPVLMFFVTVARVRETLERGELSTYFFQQKVPEAERDTQKLRTWNSSHAKIVTAHKRGRRVLGKRCSEVPQMPSLCARAWRCYWFEEGMECVLTQQGPDRMRLMCETQQKWSISIRELSQLHW